MRYLLLSGAVLSSMLSLPAIAAVNTFNGNQINLVGTATLLNNSALELTQSGNEQYGAAWLTSGLSTSDSFNAYFSFSIATNGSDLMADGITFTLQNTGTNAMGNTDGGFSLGYDGLNKGSNTAVGSIIKTHINNRVGLDTTDYSNNAKHAPNGANLGTAKLVTGNETITYNATTNVLNMTGTLIVDGTSYAVDDTKTINLAAKFSNSNTMYAGFTGATGAASSEQKITSFSISAVPEPESYAMLLLGLGLMGFTSRRLKTS